jgi:hypothetical protein
MERVGSKLRASKLQSRVSLYFVRTTHARAKTTEEDFCPDEEDQEEEQ